MGKAILFFLSLTLFSAGTSFAGFLMVVNSENKIDSINETELKYIYMMKKRTWKDGTQILPLDLIKTSEVRKSFSNEILKKSPSRMAKFYFKRALSGKGQPPKTYQTEEDIIDYIRRNVGAIGYISKSNSTVKTIEVIRDQ